MCALFTLIHNMSFLVKFGKFMKVLGLLVSLTFAALPTMSENQIPDDPDLSELTYKTELLESNLLRIRDELEGRTKEQERLFNQLQLLRYNDRIGSIQRKTLSTVEITEEKSNLAVQSYPSDDKLVEIETRVSELKSRILELEVSATRLEKEINKIRQMNSTVGITGSEIFEKGSMIIVADELGVVLGTHYCGDSSCGAGETLSVNIPRPGTYYLRLVSASTVNAPDNQYKVRPFKFTETEPVARVPYVIHLGELVSAQLDSKDKKNEYKFVVDDLTPLKIEMSSEVASASGWKLSILGGEQNSVIETIKCSSRECKNGTTLVFTPKSEGDYRVLIESGSNYSAPTGAYSFKILTAIDQTQEIEPNDQRPQKIKIGEALVGSVSSTEDLDIYSIEMQKPGRLSIDLRGEG